MSTTFSDKRDRNKRDDSFESMTPYEQLRGMAILLMVVLFAILLVSL